MFVFNTYFFWPVICRQYQISLGLENPIKFLQSSANIQTVFDYAQTDNDIKCVFLEFLTNEICVPVADTTPLEITVEVDIADM